MSVSEKSPASPPASGSARTFRIFISSPGDLGEERVICARIVDRLKAEFARAVQLQAILWEQEPLTADLDFQEQIPLPSQTDIVVLLLWSRLGHRLHSRFRSQGETETPTGTLFEFRDAINARRLHPERVPDVMVYRKTAEPPKPSIGDREKYLHALEDWERVETFFNSEFFRDAQEGAFTGAFHTFKRAGEFEENFERHLRAMIARRLGEDQAASAVWTHGSPFRGLETFDYEHRDLFAGRARAAAEVLDALRRRAAAGCAFVMVTGMSGGGKSSLARAGVLPDLTQPGVIEGIGLWRRAVLRPGEACGDLFRGLADALLAHGANGEGPGPGVGLPELFPGAETRDTETRAESLAGRLRQGPGVAALLVEGALRQAAEGARAAERERLLVRRHERLAAGLADEAAELDRRLATVKPPQARLALVIDQMEELFTDPRLDAPARETFLATLDALARGGQTWIIGTLRSDFFAQCEASPILISLTAGDGTYRLLPPTDAEIGRMIRHPADAAGLRFERDERTDESLADALLLAAARDTGALPLLEFTLDELYKRAAAENRQVLSRADYDALGGLEGALATRAEAVFAEIQARDARAAEALPAVFGALARLADASGRSGGGGAAEAVVSQSAPLDRFAPAAGQLVRALVDARLLVSDRGQVRVAHEALFQNWGRARDWIAENRDFLHTRIRVTEAAARWRGENGAEDFLLPRGKPLAEGEDLLARRRGDLSGEEIAFIEASSLARRRAERAAARRRRRVLTAISTALVAALIFAGISFWQYGRAQAAAGRAAHARNEAEKLVEFMGVDLRDKLTPIGRLELLDSANQRVRSYYESFSARPGESADAGILQHQSTALLNQGDILKTRGDLPGALKLLTAAQALCGRLAALEPGNSQRQDDLAFSGDRVGDVLFLQHDMAAALDAYKESFALRRKLVDRQPDNRPWQRGLAASMSHLADTLTAQGDLPGALKFYRAGLAIHEENVRREPANTAWQQDVYVTSLNLGDTLLTQNDSGGALEAYRRSMAVERRLCEQEPKNMPWQRELSVCSERVGNALSARGEGAGALAAYRDALAIRRRLAALDPTNADWQRDLFIAMTHMGDVFMSQGDNAAALRQFNDSLTIQQQLVQAAPDNAEWRRNLAIVDERLGQALEANKDAASALAAFQTSLEIRRALLAGNPGDTALRQDVFVSLACIGDSLVELGRASEGLQKYREAMVSEGHLVSQDPTNAEWQRGLAEIQDKAAQLLQTQPPPAPQEGIALSRLAVAAGEKFASGPSPDPADRAAWATALSHLGQTLAEQSPAADEARRTLEKSRGLFTDLKQGNATLDARQSEAAKGAESALAKLPPPP